MAFHIYDKGDGTFHVGKGDWSTDRERAVVYDKWYDAQRGLDDVDCDRILRDRLQIIPTFEAVKPQHSPEMSSLIADAIWAEEVFPIDELEEYAEKERKK